MATATKTTEAGTERAAIVERVAKLLASAERERHGGDAQANAREAAAFAAKAAALMAAWNIERAEAEAAGQAKKEAYEKQTAADAYGVWRIELLCALARAHYSKVIITTVTDRHGKRTEVGTLIGQSSNLQVVRYLLGYLAREIDRLAEQAWAEYARASWTYEGDVPQQRRYKTSFRTGAVEVIAGRLDAERAARSRADDATGAATRALVVVKDADLAAAVAGFYPNLGTWSRRMRAEGAGYGAGRRAGASLEWRSGLGGSGAPQAQLGSGR